MCFNLSKTFERNQKGFYICNRKGEMAEWSNAAVLKTVEGHTSGGSNPSFSAPNPHGNLPWGFCILLQDS